MTEQDLRIQELKEDNKRLTEELEEYKRLEEQGLLLKLPCKVGDKLHTFTWGRMIEVEVMKIEWSCEAENHGVFKRGKITIAGKDIIETKIDFSDFGKIVFITEQEAQSALEKMKGGEQNG